MNNKTSTQNGRNKMNVKRYAMIGLVIVGMAMTGCDGGGDVTTVTATPIPVGDDTATEMVDGVRDAADDVETSTFMKLWAATSFTTIDDCFNGCDIEYPDTNGAKSNDNLDCVAECKIEFD